MKFLNAGLRLRWLNNAGFEFQMANGKNVLVDPWLDEAHDRPFPLEQLERADYLLLSHIHFDHADSVKRIEEKFPHVKIFVGDQSAVALCDWLDINISNLYRMRGGEAYDFGEVRIEAISGRHTESPKGDYKSATLKDPEWADKPGKGEAMFYGTLEMLSYLITFSDGMRILVWGGMPTVEQSYRLQRMNPEIAFLHCSPKVVFAEFAQMVKMMNARFVIPHHCDGGEKTLKMRADIMKARGEDYYRRFVREDGLFNQPAYMQALDETIREACPTSGLKMLKHHRWYRFGLAMEEE
jgi:L-ascorbate metabolism protein UlaG (beta-lactamase superfamily)